MDNYDTIETFNLTGNYFTFAGVDEIGFAEAVTNEMGTKVFESGMAVNILNDLQFMLNFSSNHLVVDEFFLENFNSNESNNSQAKTDHLTSISFELTQGKADLGLGSLYFVLPRFKYGNPLIHIQTDRFYAYFLQPSGYRNAFEKPFKAEFFLCFILILCTIGVLAALIVDVPHQLFNSYFSRLQEGLIWTVATLSQQGYQLNYIKTSARVLMYTGTVLSALLSIYFSTSIIVFLTQDREVVRKLEQILELGFSMYVNPTVSSSVIFIPKSNSNQVKFIDKELDDNETIKMIFQQNHASVDIPDLFSFKAIQSGYSAQDVCNKVSQLQINGGSIKSGFYARKNFKFRSLFNTRIIKILESGLAFRYVQTYNKKFVIRCSKKTKKYQDDLGLKDVVVVFAILSACFIFSIVILAIERWVV